MSDFAGKIKEAVAELNPKGRIPKLDGTYKLPDRRILIREGNTFLLIGHRDKKRQRQLERVKREHLMALLSYPGFGGFSKEEMDKMDTDKIRRILNPRPTQRFSYLWLTTSESEYAKQMKELCKKAEAA